MLKTLEAILEHDIFNRIDLRRSHFCEHSKAKKRVTHFAEIRRVEPLLFVEQGSAITVVAIPDLRSLVDHYPATQKEAIRVRIAQTLPKRDPESLVD